MSNIGRNRRLAAKRRALQARLRTDRNAGAAVLAEASDLRKDGDRCLCGDEIKHYLTEQEAAADTSPKIICEDCGKQKLRVKWVTDRPPDENERAAFAALLKQKNNRK